MKYLTVCSGIEAPSVAWHPFGWEPAAFAEIEPFPKSVLAHHYPDVPDLGDFDAALHGGQYDRFTGSVDLVCGGTPCQSFSVAGLRKGMDDPRGNLALVYLGVVDRVRPSWVVWENVPGVLSVDGGRAFGAFVGGLVQLGYGVAWRILDAQYVRVQPGFPEAVPQRRRRVFVVGYLGDWRPPVAVLFEPEGLRGDSPPGRKKGKGIAGSIGGGSGNRGWRNDLDGHGAFVPVAHSLTKRYDSGEDGTGRGAPLVAHAINAGACNRYDYESESFITDNQVRRLTPREAERLQGFPDDYTLIPYRGKPAADGPRYKALGNSMAVNVMRWIGGRITMFCSLHFPN